MRGKRVKQLRTEDKPHPGRKYGGAVGINNDKMTDKNFRKRFRKIRNGN